MMPDPSPATEFREPLWARLFSLFVVVVLATLAAGLTLAAAYLFATRQATIGAFIVAACGIFVAALTGYAGRDLRGRWGLRVVLQPDALVLDLPGGRSLIHRPPSQLLTIPYADIAAIETRLEAYRTLGMAMMQRAYVLRRKHGELIFLFEERALATPYASAFFSKLVTDITARANVPLRDLGMVEDKGGVLGVWGTHAPDWAAPTLPLALQARLWRHAAITGALSGIVIIFALIVRLLSGPL
jgi:hypothetical protein